MATTTPNNTWPVPTSTDLVKDGAVAIEALGDAIDASVGTGLLAWQSWAPTLSGGWLNGNGVWYAKYVKIGKIVIATGYLTIGTTTTKGSGLVVSLPIAAVDARNINGPAFCGVSVASGLAPLQVFPTATTSVTLLCSGSAAAFVNLASVTSANPIAWVTGSVLSFTVAYEVA